MPINRGSHISAVIEELKALNPNSILDVGCGWGLMGAVFRAYTDIRLSEIEPVRYEWPGWSTLIEGIEVHEKYSNKLWDAVYDEVYLGDALKVIPTLSNYDFVYCGDMIEHLEKERGHELTKVMLGHAKTLCIATPSPAPTQNEILGNPHEAHRSSWDEQDFAAYNMHMVGNFGGILVVHLMP